MMEPKRIMLIDDNKFDNYYHERVIQKFDPDLHVTIFDSADTALDFLRETDKDEFPHYIFLDINMPGVNGWEFIRDFSEILKTNRVSLGLIILSTSDNPDDIASAEKFHIVHAFVTKPLDFKKLSKLIR